MKIKSLETYNFRGLINAKIEFHEKLNLFLGINGAGKSSILDAISLLMTWWVQRIKSATGRGSDIPMQDIENNSQNSRIKLTLDDGTQWSLFRTKAKEKTEKSDLSKLNEKLKSVWNRMDEDPNMPLPIVVHYRVNRSVSDIPLKIKHLDNAKREDSYANTLKGNASFRDFFSWFRMREDEENERIREQQSYRDLGLESIRQAMLNIFPDYSDMKVRRRPQALLLKKEGKEFMLNQLSDGEKCYIALVCDLASRLVMANPKGNPLNGFGIVMIDEVDLHLHPQWQLVVLPKLTETFPNCQFVVTTHSPLVVSEGIGKIFTIENGTVKELPLLNGVDYNAILRDFMGTSSQNAFLTALTDEYVAYQKYQMFDNAQSVMDKLHELVPDQNAQIYKIINGKLQ
ncbi:MAG: AAA family ATPase [Alphaproteobacteria bacterium]|nr:AAA family ATPase [Alphaproteobacteria bacterium]